MVVKTAGPQKAWPVVVRVKGQIEWTKPAGDRTVDVWLAGGDVQRRADRIGPPTLCHATMACLGELTFGCVIAPLK